MHVANVNDRLCLITDDGALDVATASAGRFGADPAAIYQGWPEFRQWAADADLQAAAAYEPESLGSPSPARRQVFGIGLNYAEHVAESGFASPQTVPPVLTKSPPASPGPTAR